MTLTNIRRLDSGLPLMLDSVESVITELDNGSYGNIEYAIVTSEGVTDVQFAFTEAKEYNQNVGGIDLVDAYIFESLGEDGGTRQYRVKGEFTAVDAGSATPEEAVDEFSVRVAVNGVVVGTSETADVHEGTGVFNFDVVIQVKDGDVLQIPVYLSTT